MPPVPALRLRAVALLLLLEVVFRCFRLLEPALERGTAIFDGDLLPLPTDVELAGAGMIVNSIYLAEVS